MNYLNNDFFTLILIGNYPSYAKRIYEATGTRIHAFSHSFSLSERIWTICHRLTSESEHILIRSLNDFAAGTDDYHTPVIIYCNESERDFISRHSADIESAFITVPYDALIKQENDKELFVK